MKKLFTFAFVTLAALAAVSCSSLKETERSQKDLQIRFKSNVSSFVTKADNGFQDGDLVGIIAQAPIMAMNVPYTVSGNTLTSETPICWLADQTDRSSFAAYYPYDPEFDMMNEYGYNLTVQPDQSTPENYHKSDFLVAETVASPGETVDLEFAHYMARIDFTVSGEMADKVASLSLANVATAMNIGSGRTVGEPCNVKAAEITTSSNKKAWSVIIVPQEVIPTVLITDATGQTQTLQYGKMVDFKRGKRYEAVLSTGADGNLEMVFVSRIFDWTNGEGVWFNTYYEKWSICGNMTDWDPQEAIEMDRVGKGLYKAVVELPEEAMFKFVLENDWDKGNYGAAGWYPGEADIPALSLGDSIDLAEGGGDLYYPQGGDVTIFLNLNTKKVSILPGVSWTLVVEGEDSYKEYEMEYAGEGLVFTADHLYLTSNTWFRFQGSNGVTLRGNEPNSMIEGHDVMTVPAGEMVAVRDGYFDLYYPATGFVDLWLDTEAGGLVLTASEDQSITVGSIITDLPDGTPVEVEGALVYSVNDYGFVVSEDGQKGLFVTWDQAPQQLPQAGDVVSFAGTRQSICRFWENGKGLPYVANATFEVIGQADLQEVNYTELSGNYYDRPMSFVSVPVQLRGRLSVAIDYEGGDEWCYFQPLQKGGVFKVPYPTKGFLKYDESIVTVTGWYFGMDEDEGVQQDLLTGVTGLQEMDHGAGTLEDPFDPTGAMLYGLSLADGQCSTEQFYVRGYARDILEPFSAEHGQCTFTVVKSAYSQWDCPLPVLEANYLENKPWVFGNQLLQDWQTLVLCGKIAKREGIGYLADGYIYAVDGETKDSVGAVEVEGDGTAEHPFNVAGAVAYAMTLDYDALQKFVYISGTIAYLESPYSSYSEAAYFTLGDGTDRFYVYCRDVRYLGYTSWKEGQTDIAKGDKVTVVCYMNRTDELTAYAYNGCLYTLNGVTVEPDLPQPEVNLEGEWSIMGDFPASQDWTVDIPMFYCEDWGEYYAVIYAREGDKFKFRKDGSWKVSLGLAKNLDTDLVVDGDDIVIDHEGIWMVALSPGNKSYWVAQYNWDAESYWTVVGTINDGDWDSDIPCVDVVLQDDYTPVLHYGSFKWREGQACKFRFHRDWSLNLGLATAFDEYSAFPAESGLVYPVREKGANIGVKEPGMYDLYLDLYHYTFWAERTGDIEAELSTIDDVYSGKNGETFMVSGTVESVMDDNVGKFLIRDDNYDSIQISGTLNGQGLYPAEVEGGWFGVEFDLACGDIVTITGVRDSYYEDGWGNRVVLKDVQIESVQRRGLGVLNPNYRTGRTDYPAEGGTFSFPARLGEEYNLSVYPDDVTVTVGDLIPGSEYWYRVFLTIPATTEERLGTVFIDSGNYYVTHEFYQHGPEEE